MSDVNPYEIINQELGIQFGYGKGSIPGYGSLSPEGANLLNGGSLNQEYDYNVFTTNESADGNYSSIMTTETPTANSISTFSLPNISFKEDWSNMGFSLENSTYSAYIPEGTAQTEVKQDSATPADGKTSENKSSNKGFSLANSTCSAYTSEETAQQEAKQDSTTSANSKSTGYKFVKDTNGKYTVEYTLNGKNTNPAKYHQAVGDIAFNKIMAELKEKNKASS